jgi:hypothetical protein
MAREKDGVPPEPRTDVQRPDDLRGQPRQQCRPDLVPVTEEIVLAAAGPLLGPLDRFPFMVHGVSSFEQSAISPGAEH